MERSAQRQFKRYRWEIGQGPMSSVAIWLATPEELKVLPDGTTLYDIFGNPHTLGEDDIDGDTRGGFLAFGILGE